MKFKPKTEEDLKREQLCTPGVYPFTVLTAADKQSTKRREDGSPKEMIALKLDVHSDDGFDYHVYDYISADFMAHKLRHFAVSVGLTNKYESGNMGASDCDGREGWCEIVVQDDKQYGPKNSVKDYWQNKHSKEAPAPAGKASTVLVAEEDDVPF